MNKESEIELFRNITYNRVRIYEILRDKSDKVYEWAAQRIFLILKNLKKA